MSNRVFPASLNFFLQGIHMYSLLHCHFESALRALAVSNLNRPSQIREICTSSAYQLVNPAERLSMLWRTVKHAAAAEPDLFTEETFHRVAEGFLHEM